MHTKRQPSYIVSWLVCIAMNSWKPRQIAKFKTEIGCSWFKNTFNALHMSFPSALNIIYYLKIIVSFLSWYIPWSDFSYFFQKASPKKVSNTHQLLSIYLPETHLLKEASDGFYDVSLYWDVLFSDRRIWCDATFCNSYQHCLDWCIHMHIATSQRSSMTHWTISLGAVMNWRWPNYHVGNQGKLPTHPTPMFNSKQQGRARVEWEWAKTGKEKNREPPKTGLISRSAMRCPKHYELGSSNLQPLPLMS